MSSIVATLQEKAQQLSPEKQTAALDYVEFLLSKEKPTSREPMTFEWAGCLSDLDGQYTSVELQKQANLWREEMALGYLSQDDTDQGQQ
jgi:Protein of unknown function (DUF2281)